MYVPRTELFQEFGTGFPLDTECQHAIRPLRFTGRTTQAWQPGISMHCLLYIQPKRKPVKLSLSYQLIFLFLADGWCYWMRFEFLYDDILEPNTEVEQPSFTPSFCPHSISLAGVRSSMTTHWLSECKHNPRDTEIDAIIIYVMCQILDLETYKTLTGHCFPLSNTNTGNMLKITVSHRHLFKN